MLNRINKTINNKYLRFFKFFFYLRYLFLIFFITSATFLLIPNFFDYENKKKIIINHLNKNLNLEVKTINKIKFNTFPLPNLEVSDVIFNLDSETSELKIKKLIIYPKLINIYNFDNFQTRKIIIENSDLIADFKGIKKISESLSNTKKKIIVKNLNLKIEEFSEKIISLKKLNFSNYGYKKNIIKGKIFENEFILKIKEKSKIFDFEFPKTGIEARLNFKTNKKDKQSGNFNIKVLKSKFKVDFSYSDQILNINESFFRGENLSFNSNGSIYLNPYFELKLNSEIKDLKPDFIKNLDLRKIIKNKNLLKKINSKNKFTFSSKKFSNSLIDNSIIEVNLAYGRLSTIKEFSISGSKIICKNKINLIIDNPVLYFDCSINTKNKKNFLKKFEVNYKNKNEELNLNIAGSINIFNNKIYFDLIEMNEDYKATNDDLKYFKQSFENILFDQSFLYIFSLDKIKNFIVEIS